jgi:hypothetical protein
MPVATPDLSFISCETKNSLSFYLLRKEFLVGGT